MIALAIALAAAAAVISAPARPVVGPLRLGEPIAEVRRRIGPGTPVRCPFQALRCAAIAFTDGTAVVRIAVANNEVDQVVLEARSRDSGTIARLPAAAGAIASWRWDGGPIFRLPARPFPGWKQCTFGADVEYCGGPRQGPRALVMGFTVKNGRVNEASIGRS